MRGKDEGIAVLLLLAAVLDVDGFYISQTMATKVASDDTFMVVCKDNTGGLPINWRNPKGAVLGPKSRPKVETGSYGTSIVFTSPHKVDDTGNYTCFTEKDQRIFELFVEPPLKFTDTDTNQTGQEGQNYVLKCEVMGGTVSWAIDGGGSIEHNEKFKVIGDGLYIRNVTRHDSKTYVCKGVQQRTGAVLDRKIHFYVKHKPVHPNHPLKHMRQDVVYGYINGSVNLTCVAVAYPPASFDWKVNDKKMTIGHIINESPEVSVLQLHIDNKAAFGNYKCIAHNKYGKYEESFTLKQGMKPVAPNSIKLKEVSGKSALFEIVEPERTPEMDLETRGFSVQYRKIDDKEWKQEEFNITKSNLYSLENLEAESEYELQAATRNAAGLSDYLSGGSWKTSQGVASRITLPLLYSVGAFILLENFAFW